MKKQAEEWLKYAQVDLLAARQMIVNQELTSVVSFHAQQCIEKVFKAVLEYYDMKIPRVHDLRKLYKEIEGNNNIIDVNYEIIDQLNQVYIDSRYPADHGLLPDGIPSQEKAREFMFEAEKIYNQVKEYIEQEVE
ncbi:HEPN domain-containing protein [Marispirochaeta aestuarii]|uniref:HEPN domain-containing protein n=1 Tax=Marispirochaeta aestuarii TaxID=1963862 RepID=UPI002ABD901D|nr:HEPN domain-containing protein [Marispirochaeta aestuarii]